MPKDNVFRKLRITPELKALIINACEFHHRLPSNFIEWVILKRKRMNKPEFETITDDRMGEKEDMRFVCKRELWEYLKANSPERGASYVLESWLRTEIKKVKYTSTAG